MDWRSYVPGIVKQAYRKLKNGSHAADAVPESSPPVAVAQKSLDELHDYWRCPNDGANLPEHYLNAAARRSEYLVQVVKQHLPVTARILEVGCNVGRNLNHLYTNGYRNLTGIEISENALALLRQSYPALAACATIHHSPLEAIVREFSTGQFDLVFSMAVLEHIHYESEWTFQELARISSRYLLTFEDESCQSWRHFARNYRNVFEPLGMKQLYEESGEHLLGIGGGFVARLFARQ